MPDWDSSIMWNYMLLKPYAGESNISWWDYYELINNVDILSVVTNIGKNSFSHCKNLEKIIIPQFVGTLLFHAGRGHGGGYDNRRLYDRFKRGALIDKNGRG